ncbi:hypothetical protein EMCRGX_G009459 [Ephydatia muelleri]
MHPDDREKTAFCTADGLFEYNVMPFGLCNASCSNISTPYGPDFGWPTVSKLTSSPIFGYPDFTNPFILDTDASDLSLGCSVGPGRRFTLRTDHGALLWLHNFKEPEGQLARWLGKLHKFDNAIVHRSGQQHSNAAAMSRMCCSQRKCPGHSNHPESVTTTDAKQTTRGQQLQDPDIGPVMKRLEQGKLKPSMEQIRGHIQAARGLCQQWELLVLEDGVLHRRFESQDCLSSRLQLTVPKLQPIEVLRQLHDGPFGGHLGEEKTLKKLRERFYWPGHQKDAKSYCNTCKDCAARKTMAPKNRAPLNSITASYPMQMVGMDFLEPSPETGYTPFLLMHGYEARLPVDIIFGLGSKEKHSELCDYVTEKRDRQIVHFDCLKCCVPGVRMDHLRSPQDPTIASELLQTNPQTLVQEEEEEEDDIVVEMPKAPQQLRPQTLIPEHQEVGQEVRGVEEGQTTAADLAPDAQEDYRETPTFEELPVADQPDIHNQEQHEENQDDVQVDEQQQH